MLLVVGVIGFFKDESIFNDSHDVLLSSGKWGVTLNNSSSLIIFLSSLFNEIFLFSSFWNLFLSIIIKGEFDGVFWDNLEPLVEGSISSLELSGIIIFRLFIFNWEFSTLSSIFSSLISLIFEGTIFIVFAGLIILGWYFLDEFDESSKKSFGKLLILFFLLIIIL